MSTPLVETRAAPAPPPAPAAPPPHPFPSITSDDPLQWPQLPPPVATKLRVLRRELADARAIYRGIAAEQKTARETKLSAELRLRQLVGSPDDPPWRRPSITLEPDHPEILMTTKSVADADAELARLAPIASAREQMVESIGQLLSGIESYVSELRGLPKISVYEGKPPKKEKGEAALDAVERCRTKIQELAAHAQQIASALYPSREAKARMRQEIERLAERGAPSVASLLHSSTGGIEWRERKFQEGYVGDHPVIAQYDPASFPAMAWALKALLIEKLEQEIDKVSDDAHAMTDAQRRDRLAEIDRERLAVERDEEHYLLEARAAGASVLRRVDLDPRAALSLSNDMPAPR